MPIGNTVNRVKKKKNPNINKISIFKDLKHILSAIKGYYEKEES